MANWIMPPLTGTRAQYGPWEIGLWLNQDFGIGMAYVLGYNAPGAGWTVVQIIDGPYDYGTWQGVINAAGGMGNYVTGKFPVIRAALARYFDTNPNFGPLDNTTPFSPDAFNAVHFKYIGIVPQAGQTAPTVAQKA